MAYFINDDCIACGDCSVVCPVEAIDDGYTYYTIGDMASTTDVVRDGAVAGNRSVWQGYRITDACNECGSCMTVCPIGAILKR